MKFKISKTATTVLKIALSVFALGFVILKIDVGAVLTIYKQSKLSLLAIAIGLFVLSKTVAAFRLNHFLKSAGANISAIYNLKLYLLGMFYNLFLPGGIGGDGYKIYHLNKKTHVKTSRLFWSVLTDRLSGILALFSLAVLLSLFIDTPAHLDYKSLIWLLIPIAVITAYLLLKKFLSWLKPVFGITTLLSIAVQVLQMICAFVIFKAIGGSGDIPEYMFLFLISSIVAMLPISIGGIGTREITFLFGSQILHLDQNISIAMSLMFYLITAFVSFWGIYYSINTKALKNPETFRLLDK